MWGRWTWCSLSSQGGEGVSGVISGAEGVSGVISGAEGVSGVLVSRAAAEAQGGGGPGMS